MTSAASRRLDTADNRVVDWWHRYLYKPYYLRSPRRFLRRLAREPMSSQTCLPWHLPIAFQPGSIIGTELVRKGIYDLVLTEGLFRLTDPGDVCVDVGANVGYTTSLLATRAGTDGHVVSFEPAPDVFALLTRNVASWRGARVASIDARQAALSNAEREVVLITPAAHGGDSSGRTLEHTDATLDAIRVPCSTLDRAGFDRIDLLKIDVEGHEDAVLEGCRKLLEDRAIRDLVFEEHATPPTRATDRLATAGYTVFRIAQGLRGPRLEAEIERPFAIYWNAPSYLASIDPARALERFAPRGWHCLRPSRP